MKRQLLGLVIVVACVVLMWTVQDRLFAQWVEAEQVIDGDTILLTNGEQVRYLGIDTPETHHPDVGEEAYGPEATEYNRNLVMGKRLRLEKGNTEEDRDGYGRLLRFVYTEGGKFVNYEMVLGGYAQVFYIPPEAKYKSMLLAAQASAKAQERGIWADISKLFYQEEV